MSSIYIILTRMSDLGHYTREGPASKLDERRMLLYEIWEIRAVLSRLIEKRNLPRIQQIRPDIYRCKKFFRKNKKNLTANECRHLGDKINRVLQKIHSKKLSPSDIGNIVSSLKDIEMTILPPILNT